MKLNKVIKITGHKGCSNPLHIRCRLVEDTSIAPPKNSHFARLWFNSISRAGEAKTKEDKFSDALEPLITSEIFNKLCN